VNALGLAARGGALVTGLEKVRDILRAGEAAVIAEASDGSADGRAKILSLAAAADVPPLLLGCLTGAELDLALGRENVVHAGVRNGHIGAAVERAARRFGGFRPLVPADWRLPARFAQDGPDAGTAGGGH
jgi:hypothetical protein